ncbi:MAG: hypothetical protein M3137_18300 [Actinomycetota bacterium]|nr:hypothetical protein [Actinomycetota bacterium]
MIRRRPPTPAQRRRRTLGVVTTVVMTVVALHGLGAGGGGRMRSAAPPGRAAPGPRAKPPVAGPAIVKVFHARGGPVTAVVTEGGAPACEVNLVGPAGRVLARGWAGARPLTLSAFAATNAPLSLVLRPDRGTRLSWQAELTGVVG